MIMILNGYLVSFNGLTLGATADGQIFCIVLSAVVVAIATLFDSNKDETKPTEDKHDTTVNPSMWVMELMTTMTSAFPAWIPGFLVSSCQPRTGLQ